MVSSFYKEETIVEKRKDSKGRILRNGEFQREDGRYEYRYTENGERRSIYSWKLTEADAVPAEGDIE